MPHVSHIRKLSLVRINIKIILTRTLQPSTKDGFDQQEEYYDHMEKTARGGEGGN